jgi:hypothetical protein
MVELAGLSEATPALAICQALVKFANASGGHDNITAAMLIVPDEPVGRWEGERVLGLKGSRPLTLSFHGHSAAVGSSGLPIGLDCGSEHLH